eukprot:Awhi_evm1s9205
MNENQAGSRHTHSRSIPILNQEQKAFLKLHNVTVSYLSHACDYDVEDGAVTMKENVILNNFNFT